jgi:quaternary ammonium compound-resistance protein SugE
MSWILLVVAGLLEVAWASTLPATHGLTRPLPTAAFLVLLAGSMFLLARASQDIPIGTAYSVWVGIGAVGAATYGMAFRGDSASALKLLFLAMLVAAIIGLKLTGGDAH